MKKFLFIILALLAIFAIAYFISDNLLIGVSALILLPLNFLFDLCFWILPLSFLILTILTVYQFIIKNYQIFDKIFITGFLIYSIGMLNLKLETLTLKTNYLLPEDFIKIYAFVATIIIIGILLSYISCKKDTRYYIPLVIIMYIYTIWYCFKGI